MTLIRREVTADRGQVFITTEDVLEALKFREDERFTTRDIALVLAQSRQDASQARVEYAVRAAVSWLVARGYIKRTKETVKRYTRNHEPYWATVYLKIERMGPCNCALLNRIFMGVEVE